MTTIIMYAPIYDYVDNVIKLFKVYAERIIENFYRVILMIIPTNTGLNILLF